MQSILYLRAVSRCSSWRLWQTWTRPSPSTPRTRSAVPPRVRGGRVVEPDAPPRGRVRALAADPSFPRVGSDQHVLIRFDEWKVGRVVRQRSAKAQRIVVRGFESLTFRRNRRENWNGGRLARLPLGVRRTGDTREGSIPSHSARPIHIWRGSRQLATASVSSTDGTSAPLGVRPSPSPLADSLGETRRQLATATALKPVGPACPWEFDPPSLRLVCEAHLAGCDTSNVEAAGSTPATHFPCGELPPLRGAIASQSVASSPFGATPSTHFPSRSHVSWV